MALTLPAPRDFGWELKTLDSATTAHITRPDGTMELTIDHSLIRGVTVDMLEWWFQNFDKEVEFQGKTYQGYLLWHPFDHVGATFFRNAEGRLTAGQRIHIREVFGRDMRFVVDDIVGLHRWDRGGIGLNAKKLGHTVMKLDHTFADEEGGVHYRSRMIVGAESGWLKGIINRLAVPRLFSQEKGTAWLRHNVEEVGCFENFLPELYARAHG